MTIKVYNKFTIVLGISILTVSFFSSAFPEESGENEKLTVIIVFPGGPEEKKEIKEAIREFVDMIGEKADFEPEAVNLRYFNDSKEALAYLRENPDSFIISSLGFFLTNRREFNLLPLARVELTEGRSEHYYLIVKKEKYKTLADLKGKTISGNTLYEDPAFLTRIVFDNQADLASCFKLAPTSRPLRAIRKVAEGKLDAALLDEAQYRSLQRLPLFQKIEVIYTSPKLPEVGLMMSDTEKNREIKDRLLSAVIKLNRTEEGTEVLEGFGLKGFKTVSPDIFNEVIKKFEAK